VIGIFYSKITYKVNTSATISKNSLSWIIALSALNRLKSVSSESLINTFFNSPNTYLLSENSKNLPTGFKVTPTIVFRSYSDLEKAFSNNSIDSLVKAVVYDSENWEFTPKEEQKNPSLYYKLAYDIVHKHNLIFIATPATNLAQVINPVASNRYDNFVQLGIARDIAPYADIYEIQAQGSEKNTIQYKDFVQKVATQVKTKNPNIIILAGLSTNPMGQKVIGDDLYNAYLATKSIVSGYWLNVPEGGSACPSCGVAQPKVAIDFLKRLSN